MYGLVAGIVKLDDLGLHLAGITGEHAWHAGYRALGRTILLAAPWLMKSLSVAGTAAMFLVGGGILTHGLPPLHHLVEDAAHRLASVPEIGPLLAALTPLLANAAVGVVAGGCAVLAVQAFRRLYFARGK